MEATNWLINVLKWLFSSNQMIPYRRGIVMIAPTMETITEIVFNARSSNIGSKSIISSCIQCQQDFSSNFSANFSLEKIKNTQKVP